jgi:hypothetical protein
MDQGSHRRTYSHAMPFALPFPCFTARSGSAPLLMALCAQQAVPIAGVQTTTIRRPRATRGRHTQVCIHVSGGRKPLGCSMLRVDYTPDQGGASTPATEGFLLRISRGRGLATRQDHDVHRHGVLWVLPQGSPRAAPLRRRGAAAPTTVTCGQNPAPTAGPVPGRRDHGKATQPHHDWRLCRGGHRPHARRGPALRREHILASSHAATS